MANKQASSQGLEWFQNAKFGMFIHWGLYSLIGHGEWVMFHEKIGIPEYEKLVPQFNPVKFNAKEWVNIAADSGQKYIVITSRHHDGFSMYDTDLSDYKITNTPFKRDPLQELAEVCANRQDVKLGFYSSLLDWHHPAYRFRNESGLAWSDYIAFLHGQVRELCTNFGQVACIWFDGDWPREKITEENKHFVPGGSFEYEKLYEMIHTLQPDAIIHNNRHDRPIPGEDVQGFEQDLPGQNSAGFNTTESYNLPIEVCMTINNSWGINTLDENHKSTRELVHILARCAGVGANYLLNVGPTPLGEILPVHKERLKNVGNWIAKNGDSIYQTCGGVVQDPPYITSTSTGDQHFIHILEYVSDCITLENVPENVRNASLVADGSSIKFNRNGSKVTLTIPECKRDPFDTVVRLV
jgi:alpha-L-fucosidase